MKNSVIVPRPFERPRTHRNVSGLIALPALIAVAAVMVAGDALAASCPGNPDAIGVSRTIVVDPAEHSRIGTMQYPESLPLADKEVVLTFDDGPIPTYTGRVLEALNAECVKATFFLVGKQSRAFPDWVRRIYNDGHTVATHSWSHPRIFTRLTAAKAHQEIEDGIAAANGALGNPAALAPFFRFPGLGRSPAIEAYLQSRGLMTWSADFPADDWTHITGAEVMKRALERLEKKGKGVLLLHDIQPATALMLPALLRELKARGYRIVHVVPNSPDRPKTVTEPDAWVMKRTPKQWPQVLATFGRTELPVASEDTYAWADLFRMPDLLPRKPARIRVASADHGSALSPVAPWAPPVALLGDVDAETSLPAPSLRSFGYGLPLGLAGHPTVPKPNDFVTHKVELRHGTPPRDTYAAADPLPLSPPPPAQAPLTALRYPMFWPHPMTQRPPAH